MQHGIAWHRTGCPILLRLTMMWTTNFSTQSGLLLMITTYGYIYILTYAPRKHSQDYIKGCMSNSFDIIQKSHYILGDYLFIYFQLLTGQSLVECQGKLNFSLLLEEVLLITFQITLYFLFCSQTFQQLPFLDEPVQLHLSGRRLQIFPFPPSLPSYIKQNRWCKQSRGKFLLEQRKYNSALFGSCNPLNQVTQPCLAAL